MKSARARWLRRAARVAAAACFAALGCSAPLHAAPGPDGAAWSAETLYRQGLLSDGGPALGVRAGGATLRGSDAACVNCHRRSGLGTSEGQSQIPPISGDFLFRPRIENQPQAVPGAVAPSAKASRTRSAYTDATLARAVREGIGSDGQPLSVLMPRYPLDQGDMQALTAYLKELGTGKVPGVGDDTLHFATIVTPDADPVARDGMLATLRQFFHDRNHIIAGAARPMAHDARGVLYRVTRNWELHVWALTGEPASWSAQLQRHFEQEPVFAVISGLGGRTWEPVHQFCEANRVPCLFPNIDAPVVRETDYFPVYFSRGVYLEAALIDAAVLEPAVPGQGPAPERRASASAGRHLVQVLRQGHGADAASRELAEPLKAAGWSAETRVLGPADGVAALARAVAVDPGSTLVLWLPPEDVAALPARPPADTAVWLSGLLGGMEQMPLPDAWRAVASLSYPLELPDRRALAMKFPEGWFRIKQVDLVAPRVQLQTYVACQVLSETLGELHISFVPEYLVERLEVMLSHRRFNGMYPRLSLGAGQRFASKGGYVAHFTNDRHLVADGDWRVP